MRTQKVMIRMVLALFFLCCFRSEARALIAFDQNYNFNFRFNTPGARANAMGGAFIGLADDATAAYSNPAGLTILKKPEISLEYKHAEYENTQYDSTGTAYHFDEEGNGLSFLSLVIPTRKATFAVYRHQLLNITNDYTLVPLQYTAETDIEAVTYGIGMGLELLPHRLSLGLSVGFTRLGYYYTSDIYPDQSLTYPPTFKYLVDSEDDAENYTLSLLWNPIGKLNIGLVYRQGPEFKTTFETLSDPNVNGRFESSRSAKNTLKVPDVYGLGVSYQFSGGLTLLADVNRILYSDLVKDFVFPNGETLFAGLRTSDYTVEDRTEFHIGVEYVFFRADAPFALRAGYYSKPEHRITYKGINADERNIAQEGESDNIFTMGAGGTFLNNVQIDVAASIGDFEQEYTLSFVYRLD